MKSYSIIMKKEREKKEKKTFETLFLTLLSCYTFPLEVLNFTTKKIFHGFLMRTLCVYTYILVFFGDN